MSKLAIAMSFTIMLLIENSQATPMLRMRVTSQPDPTAAASSGIPVWDISIYAQTSGTTSSVLDGDGGIAGLQFDLLSNRTGHTMPTSAGSGPLAARAKIAWSTEVSSNFNTINPVKRDAISDHNPTANPPYVSDGDLDALGASFSDNARFSDSSLGLADFQLIATEQWQANTSAFLDDSLRLYIVGPTYYNYAAPTTNFFIGLFSWAVPKWSVIYSFDGHFNGCDRSSSGAICIGIVCPAHQCISTICSRSY